MPNYLVGYVLVCWLQVVVNILESVAGEYPYRCNEIEDAYYCRPLSFKDYTIFRESQW